MNHQQIRSASSRELWDYLKQGLADVETEDMIYYELYEVRGDNETIQISYRKP